jgi:hypothetical protein
MKLDRLEKALVSVLLFCVLCLAYVFGCVIILERDITMPYRNLMPSDYNKAVEILRKENKNPSFDWLNSKKEYREFIAKDLGIGLYFYSEKKMVGYYGKTYPIARVIVIDSEISGYKYCETFVHEALHLKKFSGNETYISFETFRYMYETKELKNVAVCYGLEQIYGEFYEEYNVAHLIVDYLTKK